jgi:hypothetical protein
MRRRKTKLKKLIELQNPSLSTICDALELEGLGRKRNTDGRSIETGEFDHGAVQRWLRHSDYLERQRNR